MVSYTDLMLDGESKYEVPQYCFPLEIGFYTLSKYVFNIAFNSSIFRGLISQD